MADIFALFRKIESETVTVPITHIVAGLGNYGKEYENTRHNAGFMAMDRLSEKLGVTVNRAKFDSLVADTVISGKRVLLMKPQLYMNRSGEAIRKAADYYKIPPENVLVICDDVNLDVGKLRIRRKGSDGGQKGLRNIIEQLGTDAFPRIRLGVGHLPAGGDMVSWVLGRMTPENRKLFDEVTVRCVEAAEVVLSGDIDGAMSRFNG